MATIVRGTFAPTHPRDRMFFLSFVAICWLGVLFGFFPASGARMMGRADYAAPLILHTHAVAFVVWLVLLTSQVLLIRGRRVDLHMRLGMLGTMLIPVMAYSGLAAELYSQRFYIERSDDGLDFFILPLFYLVAFTGFAAAAIFFAPRDSATHKRLLLMATTLIVGAAYARWWSSALRRTFGDDYWGMILNTFAATNLILAAAIAYDSLTRGRPHRAFVVGTSIILAGQLLCSWIYHADWWIPISRELITLRLPLSY